MKTTIEALKELYVSKGGSLTDVYPDIAHGAPVGDYTNIPDCIVVLTKACGISSVEYDNGTVTLHLG